MEYMTIAYLIITVVLIGYSISLFRRARAVDQAMREEH